MVDNCDVLIAIWNGQPATGEGGTAEIVEYAHKVGRSIFWIHSKNGEIAEGRAEDRLLESLSYLDAYNAEGLSEREADLAAEAQYQILEKQAQEAGLAADLLAPLREHLLPHYVRADLLAQRYQSRHTITGITVYILAAAAVATVTIQALFFADRPQLLLLEVGEMSLILALLVAAHFGDWHRKLAEGVTRLDNLLLFVQHSGILATGGEWHR